MFDRVVASCLAPVLYWQMERDLAEPQLNICLGFTLEWKLEAESLQVSRDKETLCSVCGLGECTGSGARLCFCIICHGCARLPVQTAQRCFVPWAGWN